MVCLKIAPWKRVLDQWVAVAPNFLVSLLLNCSLPHTRETRGPLEKDHRLGCGLIVLCFHAWTSNEEYREGCYQQPSRRPCSGLILVLFWASSGMPPPHLSRPPWRSMMRGDFLRHLDSSIRPLPVVRGPLCGAFHRPCSECAKSTKSSITGCNDLCKRSSSSWSIAR